jgi:UDP-MurNAc hydroxylase
MPTIEFLGHAGLAIEHAGKQLLCDPWLTPDGAYNASWFQYPEYPHRDLTHLLHPSAVYVSHEHYDHYDPWFLAQLPRDTPVITGRFAKRLIAKKLKDLGFSRVLELDHFEEFRIADDFAIEVIVPHHNCAPHWFDSAAMIRVGGLNVFNLNDANPALELDKLRAGGIDLLLAQASPAIWYPLTYPDYGDDERRRLKLARRESAVTGFVTTAQALAPKLAIPFAGPPCFFDEALADHFLGADSMFPTAPVAAKRLSEQSSIATEVLKPGDRLHLGRGVSRVERTPAYADFDYERDRRAYFERHKAAKQQIVRRILAAIPEAAPGLFERFRRYMTPLIRRNPFFAAHINMQVRFDVRGPHGGKWVVDFRDRLEGEPVRPWKDENCQYRFEFESRNIDQVMRGDLSWEDLLLSLRFRAHRDPDRYNQHLFTFLKMSDHNALQAVVTAEVALRARPDDTFLLDANGDRYEVQRFCPHAGSDLRDAEIIGGQIVCPGHRWHFDLATGACTEANYRIFCRKLDREVAAPADKPG